MAEIDDKTPNPEGSPPSIERIWARVKRFENDAALQAKRFESDAAALRAEFEAELRKLRTEFHETTNSLKVDFEELGVRIGLLEEDVTETKAETKATKALVTTGNSTSMANNMMLQDINRKLDKLVPE